MIYTKTLCTDVLQRSQRICVVFSYNHNDGWKTSWDSLATEPHSYPEVEIYDVQDEAGNSVLGAMLDEECQMLGDKLYKIIEEEEND